MQTTSLPEIDESDLRAAREFLTAGRDETQNRPTPSPRPPFGPHRKSHGQAAVPVRNGIAPAQMRPGTKSGS